MSSLGNFIPAGSAPGAAVLPAAAPPAPPRIFELPLAEIRREYDDTYSYFLTLEGQNASDLAFTPGQYIHLLAPGAEFAKPMIRHMSIASIPSDGHIRISMSLESESPFKQAFRRIRPGDTLRVFKIGGHFTLDHLKEGTELVFIAGGIGITPIMSLIRHIEESGAAYPWKLLHIGRKHLFASELEGPGYSGLQLRTDREGLDASLQQILQGSDNAGKDAHFFVCGSAGFLAGICERLSVQGIREEQIHLEDFDR